MIRNYLEIEGYPTALADDLFVGIKDRVVALVSRVQGTFEFEVQPLREYFAARFLFDTAPDSPPGNERAGTRPDRFDALARDFYWLNVTRFFAGCYSKGELPSLVDRLEELLSERDFSDTSHPRLLSSMLLADYVFAQHPKSVGQVVELMVEKDGLRLLLGSDSPLESLSLPRGSGREQLLARCFEELSKPHSSDYSTRLGHVVRLNGDDEARMEWQSRTEAQQADDRMGWLRHGVSTGFLEQANEEWLASLLAKDFSEDAAIALMRANHWRFCEETEDRSVISIDAVLRRGELRVPRGAQCRLGSLATCMSPFTYFWAFEQQSPIGSLSAAWRRFDPPITLGPFDDDDLVATSPQLGRADSFVAVLRDRAELELSVWASSLGPWRDVIESGRSMWGDRSGFVPLAAAAAGIRAPSETAKTSSDLFDPTLPLVDRARYARLRAGSSRWWTRTLQEVDNRLNILLALTVLAMWGSQKTLSDVCGLASQLIESLSENEYREYVELVQAGHWCISGGGRAGGHAQVDPRALPTNISPRLLAALRARLPYKRALPLVQTQLMKVKPMESSIVTFVLDTLYEGCARGDVEWKSLVSYAKKAYIDRVDSEEWFWGFPWLRQRPITPIPLPVARSIVRDPSSFPLEVLRLAEASCRVAVSEKIVPVASIGARDGWFID